MLQPGHRYQVVVSDCCNASEFRARLVEFSGLHTPYQEDQVEVDYGKGSTAHARFDNGVTIHLRTGSFFMIPLDD